MRQAGRKITGVILVTVAALISGSHLMFCRISLFATVLCLLHSGAVAADVQTFGLNGGQAALAARPQAEWVRQAQLLEKQADWPGLLAWGQAWAQADAKNPLAWFVQGRALEELGRLSEAIAAYEQNVRIAPSDVFARNNLGNAYRDSGQPREAMWAYRAAVEIDPDYIQAWRNLGLTFYLMQGEAGVTQALQKLQAANPALAEVWRQLAIEYSITHDERVARKAVRVLRGLSKAERKRMFGILFSDS
jgi:tetratricopeptide (TPR) repeat protein